MIRAARASAEPIEAARHFPRTSGSQVDRVEGMDVHDVAHLFDLPAGSAADTDPDLLSTRHTLLNGEVRGRELKHGRSTFKETSSRLIVERGLTVIEGVETLRLSIRFDRQRLEDWRDGRLSQDTLDMLDVEKQD